MSDPYVGQIALVAFNFAPQGWAFCDGSLLSISENDVLFVLLGTTYGGDGQTTFGLPDLRGRVPIHQGTLAGGGAYTLGQQGGASSVTLSSGQMAAHTHAVASLSGAGTATTANGNYFASSASEVYGVPGSYVAMGSTVSPMGGSQSHDNMQPYLAMNYIISLYGIFPSQS
jgi:microcystin-dependent protein